MDQRANDTNSGQTALSSLATDLEGTPYRPVAPIGCGGMGAVFEIEHRTLGRRMVLKVLKASHRPDLEDRLRLEAQTLAQLSHPNLLEVFDFGHTRTGRPYLVTELLRGATLKDHLRTRGCLRVGEAARYVVQALFGLANAHGAGVIHRDIKSDNLFLCDGVSGGQPFVKVIDFGIAKVSDLGRASGQVRVAPLHEPTAAGIMVGTPSYVSPEQIFGQKVDQRSDLFSMGMVLYRLIAGRGPFLCEDLLQVVEANARKPAPPPSSVAPQHVPPELDAIVLRALSKSPDDRFQSAEEMAHALLPFADDAAPNARASYVTSPRRTPRGTQILVAVPCSPPPAQRPSYPPAQRPSYPPTAMIGSAPLPRRSEVAFSVAPPPAPLILPPLEPDQPSRALGMIPAAPRSTTRTLAALRWCGFVLAMSVAGALTLLCFRLLGWA